MSAALAGFDAPAWMQARLSEVESALGTWVAVGPQACGPTPDTLLQAMRYSVLDGGKRLRPLLVLASFEAVAALQSATPSEGPRAAALRAACAVELIHAYSLVHDDMPCMDNDVLRRGKPTVHVQYGEAGALLAGDALQALAFELLTPQDGSVALPVQAQLCGVLARAAGGAGMAGGQAIDLASVGLAMNEAQLRQMHSLKTGALLRACVLMGGHCAMADAPVLAALQVYGDAIGLAFQVVDDVLDVTADTATLGKTAGKDAQNDKPTYVSIMGLQRSRDYAQSLHRQAVQAVSAAPFHPSATQALQSLADMVVNRAH